MKIPTADAQRSSLVSPSLCLSCPGLLCLRSPWSRTPGESCCTHQHYDIIPGLSRSLRLCSGLVWLCSLGGCSWARTKRELLKKHSKQQNRLFWWYAAPCLKEKFVFCTLSLIIIFTIIYNDLHCRTLYMIVNILIRLNVQRMCKNAGVD